MAGVEDGSVKRERFDYWHDVYGFDMTPIKEIAIMEPVVDVIDPKAIVTNAVPILRLDILICKKEDLEFTAKFRLQAHRDDYIHGFVTYFGTCLRSALVFVAIPTGCALLTAFYRMCLFTNS
jgi:protein arginine N-methyltransferase 1